MYADDTIVLAESPGELQCALDAVYTYCNNWNLTVNTSKTKIVIFSRGKIRKHGIFYYGEKTLDVVYDYVYLGCLFNYNNKFSKSKARQISQGKRAMFGLLKKLRCLIYLLIFKMSYLIN